MKDIVASDVKTLQVHDVLSDFHAPSKSTVNCEFTKCYQVIGYNCFQEAGRCHVYEVLHPRSMMKSALHHVIMPLHTRVIALLLLCLIDTGSTNPQCHYDAIMTP